MKIEREAIKLGFQCPTCHQDHLVDEKRGALFETELEHLSVRKYFSVKVNLVCPNCLNLHYVVLGELRTL
jgi:hypothetical protein